MELSVFLYRAIHVRMVYILTLSILIRFVLSNDNVEMRNHSTKNFNGFLMTKDTVKTKHQTLKRFNKSLSN